MKTFFITIFCFLTTLFLFTDNVSAANSYTTDLELSSSQYWSITDANQTGLDITGDMSIQLWVKFETVPTNDYDTWILLSKMNTNNYSYEIFYQYRTAWGEARLGLGNSSNGTTLNEEFIDYQFTVGNWYNITIVYDASAGEVDFYINGTATGGTQTGAGNSIYNGNATFQIGAASIWSVYFDGLIDNVIITNDELTSQEISNYYDCGITNEIDNIVGHWNFENDGTDETDNGNDLTNNNSATFQSSSLPFTDDCETPPEEPTATTTPSQLYALSCTPEYQNDISFINACSYTSSTTGATYTNYHFPFLLWVIIALPMFWIGTRLIVEIIIRFRK